MGCFISASKRVEFRLDVDDLVVEVQQGFLLQQAAARAVEFRVAVGVEGLEQARLGFDGRALCLGIGEAQDQVAGFHMRAAFREDLVDATAFLDVQVNGSERFDGAIERVVLTKGALGDHGSGEACCVDAQAGAARATGDLPDNEQGHQHPCPDDRPLHFRAGLLLYGLVHVLLYSKRRATQAQVDATSCIY